MAIKISFDDISELEDFVELFDENLSNCFHRIEAKLDTLLAKETQQIVTLEELQAQVEVNTSVNQSAVTLIQGLAAKLEEIADDPEQIAALAASLKSSSDSLAAAVSANTPQPPPPPPPTA